MRIFGWVDRFPALQPTSSMISAIMKAHGAQRLSLAAAGAAFWLVIALIPTTVACLTVVGLVVDRETLAAAINGTANYGPASLGRIVVDQALVAANGDDRSLSIGLLVSIAVILWSVSSGIHGISRAIRGAYGLPVQAYAKARAKAFATSLTVVIGIGLLWAVAAVLLWVADLHSSLASLVVVFVIPLSLLVQVIVYTCLFRLAIARRTPLDEILPGAVLAAIAITALLTGFAAYVSLAPNYQAMYGTLAGFILLMITVYLATYALLLAAVFNAQLLLRRGSEPAKAISHPGG